MHEQVVGNIGLEYEYPGEQEVINMEKPVRVYRVLSVPGTSAQKDKVLKIELKVKKDPPLFETHTR